MRNQTSGPQASTISNKLNSLLELFKFSRLRFAFFGLTIEDMELTKLKIDHLKDLLKPFKLQR